MKLIVPTRDRPVHHHRVGRALWIHLVRDMGECPRGSGRRWRNAGSASMSQTDVMGGSTFVAKPGYKRAERVADQIRMEIADILLRKTKDPRLHSVTVTDVELTDDLRLARIYVSTIQRGGAGSHIMVGLERAAGFIRGELGRRLSLRYNPALEFHRDLSGPRGDRILALLEGLRPAAEQSPTAEAGERPVDKPDDDRGCGDEG